MIAIVGASGFVGRHLARRLREAGLSVRAVLRDSSRARALPAGIDLAQADLLDRSALDRALGGASVVVHAAAITADRKEAYPGQYRRVHVDGTRNLVEAARAAGVQRIVLLNGLGTRRGGEGSYMRTRWEMGEAVRTSSLGWVALQPSILFGKGAPFPSALARLARRSPVMPVLGGGRKLQPMWIEDLVTCLQKCAQDPRWDGRAIDLGGPEQLTFAEVTRLIVQAAGVRRPMVPLPLPMARLQARAFSLLPNPPLVPATLELFDFDNITDLDVVRREFGFEPRSMRAHLNQHGLDH
jgi:uncharacterized protein YbjT (DUF2867 family)